MPTPTALFGAILFGAIGMAAFVHGKRQTLVIPMILGIALMVFPYFVSDALPEFLVGIALTAAAWKFRE